MVISLPLLRLFINMELKCRWYLQEEGVLGPWGAPRLGQLLLVQLALKKKYKVNGGKLQKHPERELG